MQEEVLLFVVPVYAMSQKEFTEKWDKYFMKYKKHPMELIIKSTYFPKNKWKYNQVMAYIEIYNSRGSIEFRIFKAKQKRSKYNCFKTGYSFYPKSGDRIYITKKMTNQMIKQEILEKLEKIRKNDMHVKNAYLDLEVFNTQIQYMDIRSMFY